MIKPSTVEEEAQLDFDQHRNLLLPFFFQIQLNLDLRTSPCTYFRFMY